MPSYLMAWATCVETYHSSILAPTAFESYISKI